MSTFYCTDGAYQAKGGSAHGIGSHAYVGGSSNYRSTFYFNPTETFSAPIVLTRAYCKMSTSDGPSKKNQYNLMVADYQAPRSNSIDNSRFAAYITLDSTNNTYRQSGDFTETALKLISDKINNGQTWYLLIYRDDLDYCRIAGTNNSGFPKEPIFYFEWQYGRSTGTFDKAEYTNLNTPVFTINPLNNAYLHKITWQYKDSNGNYQNLEEESSLPAGTKSSSLNLSTKLKYNHFPANKNKIECRVILKTFSGEMALGEFTETFSVTLDKTSFLPTVSGLTLSPNYRSNTLTTDFTNTKLWIINDTYLTSKFTLSSNYGANIVSYKISITGAYSFEKQFKNPSNLTINFTELNGKYITKTGTLTFKVLVKDSRGQENSSEDTVTIYNYSKPYLSNINYYRVGGDNVSSITGNYIYGNATINYTKQIDNFLNRITQQNITLSNNNINKVKENSISLTSTDNFIIDSNSQTLSITIKDRIYLNPTTTTVTIPSSSFIMHFRKGGKALAFGGVASDGLPNNTIKTYWNMEFNSDNGALKFAEGGTEAKSREGAFNSIVSPGGTISGGNLIMQKDLYIHNSNAFPQINFRPLNAKLDVSKRMGTIYLYTGQQESSELTQNRFAFRQYGYNTTNRTMDDSRYDTFTLPNTPADVTGINHYQILTEKESCYHPGETALIQGMAFGLITDSARRLILEVPLFKSLKRISSITVNSFIFAMMRAGGGNLSGSTEFAGSIHDVLICKEKNSIILNCWREGTFANLKTENAVVCDFGFGVASGANSSLLKNDYGLKLTFN